MLKDKDSKQSIQVTIRVRPLSQKQKSDDPRVCVLMEQSQSLSLVNAGQMKKFTFDSISYQQSQQQIFERVGRRCTKDCLEGYNCTIFAYGQTGAGKTYTMMGVTSDHEDYQMHRGLIPRTMRYLFDCIDEERGAGIDFIIRCSFLEIYNQQIIDLLNKNNNNLQLREDTRKGVYVEGITEQLVGRSDEIMQLLIKGSKSRHVGSTVYNEASSRSHSVFTMNIESKYTKNGVVNRKSRQFNFIDLAGSERTKMSTGERLKEGCNINKSLMNLASVINSLSEVSEGKSQHVNYRNSKLTFLLKDSLGGNSKTNLIANISPSCIFYQETLSTLSFARRAKLIKREKASINEDSSGNLDSMKNEIKRLKQEVITLMGRLQTEEGILNNHPSANAPQMTSIMHQYVAQEIDKQTRLQMEILKLKERISYLQDGVKHYASSQTHLRMIITVLEDKITRLKAVESRMSFNVEEIDVDEERVKAVKEYFQQEREELLKQVQALKGQSQGTRIIKQLLKHAKVMKEDGQQQESLKDLLNKNTGFLSMIHAKLEQIAPQKQEIQFNEQFEKKVSEIQIQHHKKQQQYVERMDLMSVQLCQAKQRNQENEKMLEEAVNVQIQLEEKIVTIMKEKDEVKELLKQEEDKREQTEKELKEIIEKNQLALTGLNNELLSKQQSWNLLNQENQGFKDKIQEFIVKQKSMRTQFDSLEEENCKLDKVLLQNLDEIKEQRTSLFEAEQRITMISQQKQAQMKEKDEIKQLLKSQEAKRESTEKELKQIIEKYQQSIGDLKKELLSKQESWNLLNQETQGLQAKIQELLAHQKTMKIELDSLEEENCKLDKVLLQNLEEIKEQKISLVEAEQKITMISQQKQAQMKEKDEVKQLLKSEETKREQTKKELKQIIEKKQQDLTDLNRELLSKQESWNDLNLEILGYQAKIQDLLTNQKTIKVEANILEEEKSKFQNIILEKLDDIQKQKTLLLEAEQKIKMILQQKQAQMKEKDEVKELLKQEEDKREQTEKELKEIIEKNQLALTGLNNELLSKQQSWNLLNQENQGFKDKIQEFIVKQKSMRTQFDSLEEENCKLDKVLLQNLDEIKEQRTSLFEAEQRITMISQQKQAQMKEKDEIKQLLKSQEAKRESTEKELKQIIEKYQQSIGDLKKELLSKQESWNLLNQETQGLQAKIQELLAYQKTMKIELDSLEEENCKLDKVLLQNLEEIKEQKISLVEAEQRITMISQQKQAYMKEKDEIKQLLKSEETKREAVLNKFISQKESTQIQLTVQKQQVVRLLNDQIQQLKSNLQQASQRQIQIKKQLNDSNKFARDLSKALQSEKSEVTSLKAYKKSSDDQKLELQQNQKKLKVDNKSAKQEINKMSNDIARITQEKQTIELNLTNIQAELDSLKEELSQLKKQNTNIVILSDSLKDKITNFEVSHVKLSAENKENAQFKQKWELQSDQLELLKNSLLNQKQSKERIYDDVCHERENNSNFKMIIENSEAQVRQLEIELEQKDSIYKKLLEKIAKNENESKKTTNSEHYLKTIELLEKSRSEQLELRRQSDDLKKVNSNMKDALQEKESYIRDVEKKSEGYCVSMHKRLEQIQKDYFELERNQERLIKEKKAMQKYSHQNQSLKDEVKTLKTNINKMVQRQEELETRFKKCNIDYIQLQKEFQDLKKGQVMVNTHDDKTNYINRLKAQIASLKTQKVLLTDSLNKEREEKTKLRADMRFGKDSSGDIGGKIELEKKINQNKNLQQLIFEIVSHLKICVNEPRTKLETIRSVILGTIKERSSQVKNLRERVKELEDMQEARQMTIREPALREYRGANYSQGKSKVSEEMKFQKQKDPSVLDNYSRQKMKEFQNYYAKFKQGHRNV